ncbi:MULTISPECIES: alpha/beta hydrolase [Ramlibacter]|uniref:Alpha/beta hydrolase fold domain-containing protein n=1 Tax=Ramlibacter pinisoli TaxID=2682844 RepID=A0A6N8IP58_9BURK|nr:MULTISPECIES: alpha/beta hydrolase [Ramlibacter]MBA2963653.1 alpha/beta hydrolase [Ramlibacter sp. CGMCC 1.13660]MVQ28618.1 alpha/beta hydrolase fold domain-containing protein [Ramlibacter pinisoli]
MLHPQAQALLRLIESRNIPPTHTLTPQQAREFYRVRRAVTQPEPPDVADVRELQASGPAGAIPLRLYRPAGSRAGDVVPVLVYFHGGGWVIGDLDTHDVLCRTLANGAGCAVVAVDYRLGPESRFPAAMHDCVAATQWVVANAAALQVDPTRLAVGGDSAGGNLATVVALAARDGGGPAIRYQLLIYPATDQRTDYPSRTRNGKGYLLEQETVAYYHDLYIDDPRHDQDWRASPILHPDLAGLPPALVLVAGYDPLRDEGVAYAQKLDEAGNRATLVSFERQIHGFITMGKVIDEANAAVRLCAAELRAALA